MTPRFEPGARVRVKADWPEAGPARVHIRTPHFVRGLDGVVERVFGAYPNPEKLAFGRPAERVPLYHVRFDQRPIWQDGKPGDSLSMDIYEHWLEPAE